MSRILYKDWKIDVKGCFEEIDKKNTYSLRYRQNEYNKGYFQPPNNFYKITDINVSEIYDTNGLDIRDIQLFLHGQYSLNDWDNTIRLFNDLLSINPQLNRFKKIKSSKDKWDIIFGVASLINPDDIEFYIGDFKQYNGWRNYQSSSTIFRELFHILSKFDTGINMNNIIQWIISPKTAQRIINKIKML